MRNVLVVLLLSSGLASAQVLSFGVKGGALLTDPAERFDQSRRYVVGPSIEVSLPGRLAIEGNALYSRFGSSLGLTSQSFGRTRGNSWEFPVLGKYYFSESRAMRPFVSAGASFRNIWIDSNDDRSGRRLREDDTTGVGVGAAAGGGVALRFGRFMFAPEARYTRWGGFNFPATNPNEAKVLLGVSF
jgi:hypothetical protein